MASDNTDAADLEAQDFSGIINEDVMQAVFDVSRIPLPFLDRIGSEASRNQFKTWLISTLPAPDVTNAVVDGSDATTPVQNLPDRVGNRHQILEYTIAVSTRARNVDTIATADELARQLMEFNQAIRRDLNAIMLEPQASVVDDGAAVAGKLGGFPSWLTTSTFRGALGADGGFDLLTGLVDAPTAGTARGLTETLVKDAANAAYVAGGNPSILHSRAGVIRGLSDFMFDASARIATLRKEAAGVEAATAIGSVNVMLTDHGITLEFVSDRLQQTTTSGLVEVSDVFLYDPEFVGQSYIHNVRVDPLGKPGLSDKRQLSLDGTLIVHNEAAHALIADIDETVAVIQ